jgi:hypothetical protein
MKTERDAKIDEIKSTFNPYIFVHWCLNDAVCDFIDSVYDCF